MTVSNDKKMEYIAYVLLEVGKGTIESGDSVLLDIALIFIEDLQKGTPDGDN
tara:strand:- start:338 stop:493 length:156 start_codon:yes stop_codon:yes gene_type:complete